MLLNKDICPVCGSKNTKELYPSNIDLSKLSFTYVKNFDSGKTFRAVKCISCTHVFCSPIPKDIYKNYEDVVDYQYLKYVSSIKESAKIILPQIKKIKKTGVILDVGCATGEFLLAAKAYGYKVEGLELSKWSSHIAREKNIKIYNQKLSDLARRNPGKYDIITLFGVIEHFEKPYDEFSYICRLLKKSGIVVVWTGDVNSISSKILKKNWWYWQGQHIQYFSDKSIIELAKKTKIKHLFTKIYPFVATYPLLENSLSRYSIGLFLSKFARIFFFIKPKWVFYIPGEMLWFGKKVS